MSNLKNEYKEKIIPNLVKEFEYKNVHEIPKLIKINVSCGLGLNAQNRGVLQKATEETRKKISKNHHDVTGENNPMYGKNHSPETIEKLKNAAKNRPKRIWVNNMVEEKLIPFDSEIPLNYIKGRLPFK
jgi:ribosome recycling factor